MADLEFVSNCAIFHEGKLGVALTEEDLRVGDKILIPTPMGGFWVMEAKENTSGVFAECAHSIAFLTFEDGHWITTGAVNKRGLERL